MQKTPDYLKWIHIETNIFENRKIQFLETLPDSDTIIVIWLKLLTLAASINDSGMIYLTREIPFTEEIMAAQFRRPVNTVRLALNTFKQLGMITIIDDVMKISNWEKYQITDADRIREQTRQRVQKHRELKRLEMHYEDEEESAENACNVTVTQPVTLRNAVEKKRIEENREEENKKEVANAPKKKLLEDIINQWNAFEDRGDIPTVKSVSYESKTGKSILVRVKQYGIETVTEVIENVFSSDFLRGKDGKWCARFDWVFLPNNFEKILNGNYNTSGSSVYTNGNEEGRESWSEAMEQRRINDAAKRDLDK